MPHWKSMMDRDYIFAFDLGGKDVVVEIARVVAGKLTGSGGKTSKKPVMYFKGKEKGLALNATNAKTITAMFGSPNTDDWIGKRITLYPTTTTFGSETVDCIRVRPKAPQQAAPTKPGAAPPVPQTDDEARDQLGADDASEGES